MSWPNPLHVLTLLIGIVLTSCIDSDEEIWLNKNGSGRARITLTVPKAAVALQGGEEGIAELVGKLLGDESSVSEIKTECTPTGKRFKIVTSFRFDSATRLYESLTDSAARSDVPSAIQHIIGITTVERTGIGLSGKREMNFGRAIPGIGLFSAGGKNHQLQTTVHLPFKPSSHNATRTTNAGKTLIWKTSLEEAMRNPHSQQVSYQLPLAPIITGALLTTIVIALLIRRWRSHSKRLPDATA